jgi:hypothetical protein
MTTVSSEGDYKGKLKNDYFGKIIADIFKKSKLEEEDRKKVQGILSIFNKSKPIPPLSDEEGNRYLNLILVRELKNWLDPNKLFTVKPSEKGKRSSGQFIFTNKLMKYFDENQLSDILIEATKDKITLLSQGRDWYTTVITTDDFIFNNKEDVKMFGFLFQVREAEIGYIIASKSEGKLVMEFKPYVFDKKKYQEAQVAQIQVTA